MGIVQGCCVSGNSHLRREKRLQENLKKIKETVLTILKYTEDSVQHKKNTLSNSITVGFYVKGLGEPGSQFHEACSGLVQQVDRRIPCSKPIWKPRMSGTLGSRQMNTLCVACTTEWEAHQKRVCCPTWVPGACCHQAQEIHCQPRPPCQLPFSSWESAHASRPEPWRPGPATTCHPAPHHTAIGLGV